MITLISLCIAGFSGPALSSAPVVRLETRTSQSNCSSEQIFGGEILKVGSYIYDGSQGSAPEIFPEGQQFVDMTDSFEDLIKKHGLGELMPAARQWVAQEFYADGPATLGALRLRAGLTQSQLAKLTGQPQSAISRLESGSESPSLDRAKLFADALNVSLDEYHRALEATRRSRHHG